MENLIWTDHADVKQEKEKKDWQDPSLSSIHILPI